MARAHLLLVPRLRQRCAAGRPAGERQAQTIGGASPRNGAGIHRRRAARVISVLAALLLTSVGSVPARASDANEPNDEEGRATRVLLGTPVRGELPETYDRVEIDYFRFTARKASQRVAITLTYWGGLTDPPGTDDCARCGIYITLRRLYGSILTAVTAGGREVKNSDGTYTVRLSYTLGTPGEYALDLVGADDGRDSSYLLSIDSPDAEPPPLPEPKRGESLVAFGDSVTAGFGYRDDGTTWAPADIVGRCNLFGPATECQAPSTVSWPRLLADRLLPRDWVNSAESGSTPSDWATGRYRSRLDGLVTRNPTIIGLTLGANPLLSWILFEPAGQGCLRTPRHTDFLQCLAAQLEKENTRRELGLVFRLALRAGMARVYAFHYHETSPRTARGAGTRVRDALRLLNDQIDLAAADVQARTPGGARLRVVDPGDFSEHGCDSPEPWVLSTDTCIHPNAAGMREYARAIAAIHARDVPASRSASAVFPRAAWSKRSSVGATLTLRRPSTVAVRLLRRVSSAGTGASQSWRVLAVRRVSGQRGDNRISARVPASSAGVSMSRLRLEFIVRDADGRTIARRLLVR